MMKAEKKLKMLAFSLSVEENDWKAQSNSTLGPAGALWARSLEQAR
jgi:hypothetical protein